MEAKVRAALMHAVAGQRKAMVELTQRLVGIPTENPPGNCYSQAAELIHSCVKALGFEARLEHDCVLAYTGQGERTLYFSGHYDVVPAQSRAQFEPTIKGGHLWGRGSSDMKGGLAAMVYAAKAVRDCGIGKNGRLGLIFVPDEETAGPRGSRYLAACGLLGENGVGMLTPEPTGGMVWNASRGAITLKVTVKGRPAHVGRQFEGVNAFEKMIVVAQDLFALKREVEERITSFETDPEAARGSILMIGGQSQGGNNFNVVPGACWFTVDRRINPEEDFDIEKRRLLSVLEQARAHGIELETEVLQEGNSCGVPAQTLVGQELARSIEQVTGRAAKFQMCPGLLEIRFYAERGIPSYAYGPGLLTVSHGPNEFVPIERIVQCAEVYALTATEVLKD